MRYSVISKGTAPDSVEAEIKKAGGKDIARTTLLGHMFCELDEGQAKKLAAVAGLTVKPVKEFRTHQTVAVCAG